MVLYYIIIYYLNVQVVPIEYRKVDITLKPFMEYMHLLGEYVKVF